ncbi:hypothetical protein ARMSODRAFT_63516 [Armillaria solidipes]|uniref:Uncharacterized protein n=1 Tax=Armillaria solidipes TaxID=1076256 RepID=A0A2H3BN65_9AGAR|nr:hypothetical protein ARMSODRAFT_63516 [Armillaria solidipes]
MKAIRCASHNPHGAFATLDPYRTAASELSSALAVYLFSWMIVTVLFFINSASPPRSSHSSGLSVTSILPIC